MAKTVVVYHSGYGHTQRVAQFVAQGANAQVIAIDADGNITEADWAALDAADTETLNHWPLRHVQGDRWQIEPGIAASSGETLRQLALEGQGIACLSHFMTIEDINAGRLQSILAPFNSGYRQPINAVYYRNSQLALRIQCFLDFIQEKLARYAC
eukprot:gene27045-33708_t